jgi:hypothetical protein
MSAQDNRLRELKKEIRKERLEKRLSHLKNLDEKQCAYRIISNIATSYIKSTIEHASREGRCEEGRCKVSFLVEAMEIADCSNKMNRDSQFANKTFTEVRSQLREYFDININRVQYSLAPPLAPPHESYHKVHMEWNPKYSKK